jgi:TetR/AcrR family transcriptional regulator, transcriptional repressor for nem operon
LPATLAVFDRPVNYAYATAVGRTSDARERIVRAAARLFLTRSYNAVAVDELCAAAEVRKGSFYYYFASKADLAKAVIDLHAQAFEARLDDDEQATPVQRLHAAADAIGTIQMGFETHFGRVVGCPFGNLAAELATTDDDVRGHVAAVLLELERRLALVCREAAEQGLLRGGVAPDRLAHALLAQYQGMILLAKVNASSAAELPPALHELIDANLSDPVGT